MQVRIIYIEHNCFFLQFAGRTLLFDYPAAQFRSAVATQVAASMLAGTALTVFSSHSHEDHFDPDILTATQRAASRRFVVSDDVADRFGDRLPADTLVMEPGEQRELDGLGFEALESNDLGVAYRIEGQGLSAYFGGDLALWNWPGQRPAAARAVGMSWRRTLARLRDRPVDVAFSNMDPRLPSLSGAADFVAAVAPRVFVPMHLGGHVEYLSRFTDRISRPGTTLFRYAKPGDAFFFEAVARAAESRGTALS